MNDREREILGGKVEQAGACCHVTAQGPASLNTDRSPPIPRTTGRRFFSRCATIGRAGRGRKGRSVSTRPQQASADRQLYAQARERILSGALPPEPGSPPERTLARRLGVNQTTVVTPTANWRRKGWWRGGSATAPSYSAARGAGRQTSSVRCPRPARPRRSAGSRTSTPSSGGRVPSPSPTARCRRSCTRPEALTELMQQMLQDSSAPWARAHRGLLAPLRQAIADAMGGRGRRGAHPGLVRMIPPCT